MLIVAGEHPASMDTVPGYPARAATAGDGQVTAFKLDGKTGSVHVTSKQVRPLPGDPGSASCIIILLLSGPRWQQEEGGAAC